MGESMWGGSELDLRAYLQRVGYRGPLTPTAETLRALHRAHVAAFAFENVEIMLNRPVRLDVRSLQAKMVERRRGGYCFEQNSLFGAVLDRLGFTFTGLSARVCGNSGVPRPRSHMLLSVDVDGRKWLADVGFGGDGLLQPLRLACGAPVRQGGWEYSVTLGETADTQAYVLRSRHRAGWLDVYTFTLQPYLPVDYEVLNYFISTHPKSPFTYRLVVQRSTESARHRLTDQVLVSVRPDGTEERDTVPAEQLPDVLAGVFGIELDSAEAEAVRRRCRETAEHGG